MTGFELWNEITDSLQEIDYAIEYMGVSDKAKCQISRESFKISKLAGMFLKETQRLEKSNKELGKWSGVAK